MPTAAARTAATPPDVNVEWLPTDELLFDDMNPRLGEERDTPDGGDPQLRILEDLWRDFAVDEIALSVAANGDTRAHRRGEGVRRMGRPVLPSLRLRLSVVA